MSTPPNPLHHSPMLSAVFHMLDNVLDLQLREADIDEGVAHRIRQRVKSTLIWGDPDGLDAHLRLRPRELTVAELMAGQPGKLKPPEHYVVVASRTEQARNWASRTLMPPSQLSIVLTFHDAQTKLRGRGGPGDQIVVLEYPDEGTEEMVRVVSSAPGAREVMHPNAGDVKPASVPLGQSGKLKASSPPEVHEEITPIVGPDEPEIRAYAAKHGYPNVYAITSRNPSLARGLALGCKVILIGRTSPDIERILLEGGHQIERVEGE